MLECVLSVCRHMSFVTAYARLFASMCGVPYTDEVFNINILLSQYLLDRMSMLTQICSSEKEKYRD